MTIPCFLSWSSLIFVPSTCTIAVWRWEKQNLQWIFKMWEPFSYIQAKNIFSLVLNSFHKKIFFIIAEHNTEVFWELATIIAESLPGIISLNLEPECTGYAYVFQMHYFTFYIFFSVNLTDYLNYCNYLVLQNTVWSPIILFNSFSDH